MTNPVTVEALHDYLLRISVQVGTSVYPALLDLADPNVQLSPPIREELGVQDGPLDSFRMGYSGWPSVPVEVILTPTMRGWGGETSGFVLLGAPVALDCALAISWRHKEVRTCIR